MEYSRDAIFIICFYMKNIKLFDYQEDMKERIEKALRLHRSVMAQMPTGTGKTVLLASVVESFLREHSDCNVWIVAHRRELVSQIKDTLNKFLLNFSFSNHPVPLSKEGSTFSPSPSSSGSGDVTALLGARNRYALRLADHQRSRQIVRDGTALLLLACGQLMALLLLACGLLRDLGTAWVRGVVMGLVPLLPLLLILLLT